MTGIRQHWPHWQHLGQFALNSCDSYYICGENILSRVQVLAEHLTSGVLRLIRLMIVKKKKMYNICRDGL